MSRPSPSSRWVSRLPSFARRAFHVDQMEFDSALSQMYSLLVKPSLVSKMSKARSMTKNHYYRDDPAFVLVQLFFVIVADVAWCFGSRSAISVFFGNLLFDIVFNYVIASVVFATTTWVTVNQCLVGRGADSSDTGVSIIAAADGRQEVEWQYAFDVHCNAYFPYFIWTRVITYIALPLISVPNEFLPRFMGNTIVFIGCAAYVYNVFLGYLELPMLVQQQRLLYPILLLAVLFFFFTFLTSWNVPLSCALPYWGKQRPNSFYRF